MAAAAVGIGQTDRTRIGKSGEWGVGWAAAGGGISRPSNDPSYRRLPADVEVSSLGLGAWSWGDRSRYWQSEIDKPSNLTVRWRPGSL